ncbi:hypothetical protein E2562_036629 [Oryza meyeriana var. granulata]|uniref:Uncharacterized protein n=1 Tax=Oryza meyeriana var. granulata TaxID=110450 RepID=A0A6G1FGE1_9ORYZ|nr:hypothetical protein E2562_036629 [Oryza meyeriana var. granulata]
MAWQEAAAGGTAMQEDGGGLVWRHRVDRLCLDPPMDLVEHGAVTAGRERQIPTFLEEDGDIRGRASCRLSTDIDDVCGRHTPF